MAIPIEMEEALAALEEANEADPTVRRLSPGKATRRVLLDRPKEAAPEMDPNPEEPAKT